MTNVGRNNCSKRQALLGAATACGAARAASGLPSNSGISPGATNERESHIMVDSLSRGGIDATSHVFGVQRTSQDRSKSPGLFGGSKYIPRYHSAEIARPENRWTGANRFGYANPEMDRLINGWDTTLDRSQRLQHMLQMERIALTELPALPMYWNPRVMAWVGG